MDNNEMFKDPLPHKSDKRANKETHRFFYINGRFEFGLFDRGEKDKNQILETLYNDRDFISMKENIYPEWKSLKLINYDPVENVYWLESKDKVKNTDVRNKKIIPDENEPVYNTPIKDDKAEPAAPVDSSKKSLI